MPPAARSPKPPLQPAFVTYFDGDLNDRAMIRVSLRGNLRTGILHVRVRRNGLSATSSFPAELTEAGLAGEDVQRAFVIARSLHLALNRPRAKAA